MFTFQEYPFVLLHSTPMLHNLNYWTQYTLTGFWAQSQNHEKWLLSLSHLSNYTFIHMELDSHWTDLHEIGNWDFFKTLSRKFKFQQALYMKILYIYDISQTLLRMRNVSDTRCRKNKKTHSMFSSFFYQSLYHLWDNVEKYGRARQVTDDNTIPQMHFACWIN